MATPVNLPPGFQLDTPAAAPPPGFQLDAPQEQEPQRQQRRRGQAARRQTEQAELEREQFLASLPPERRQLIESISPAEAALIGAGRGFTTIGRGLGLVEPEDPAVTESIEQLRATQPTLTGGEIAGQAAPFLAPGLGAAGLATLPARVGATAALGAAEGGLIARGEGRDVGQQLLSAGVGGTVAGAVELGLPVLGRLGSKVVRRSLGRAPRGAVIDAQGNPSEELVRALDAEGLQFDDLVNETVTDLKRQAVDPEQAARKAFLESQGLTGEAAPTRAQITRSVDDFALQQEALKSEGRVEQRIAAQDRVLTTRFNDAISETAGDPFAPTSSVTDSLQRKASVLDDEIGALYRQARERAGNNRIVRFNDLSKTLKRLAPLNQRAGGNVSAVAGTMQDLGLLDRNLKPTGRIGVEETETQIRQFINSLYSESISGGDPQNAVLRQMKEALDNDVFRASGDDLFKEARSAKARFEQGLNRAKISKFDTRKKNLVRDVLENKDSVNPERFTNNVVFGKSWRSTDLEQLKDYIGTEQHGVAAWNDLKADVLQKIKERAFIGPEDGQGFQSLSRDKLSKALSDIGDKKLAVIFSPQERKFLRDMQRVAAIREPRKLTQQGFGPSAKAILRLEKKMSELPVIGGVFGFLDIDSAGRISTRSAPAKLKSRPLQPVPGATPLGLAAGAASTQALGEE